MGFVQRRILKLVLGVVRRPWWTLGICGLALAGCVALAVTRLSISSDQNRLFSDKVSFFADFLHFVKQFPENEALYVLVEARSPATQPSLERWTEIADAITERLRQMDQFVRAVDSRVPLDQLGVQGLLFEDPRKLPGHVREIVRFGALARLWGDGAGPTMLLGPTPIARFIAGLNLAPIDAQTAGFVDALASSWSRLLSNSVEPVALGVNVPDLAPLGAASPQALGYYYTPDETDRSRSLLLVRVYPKANYDSLTSVSESVDAIRAAVAQVAAGHPEFKVGITGRPALEADEMRTSDRDSHRAETVALIVVFIAMVLMLRSLWLALVAEISLGVGIGWTFGWATLSIGELNLLSIVFVIALIGIGMDYLVQVLTRYRREARRYVRPAAVWARVFRYVSPPILTACLGAAGAFFVSIFTDFRGAAELGIIAGGGLLLCLLAGYTVLPALLVLWPARLRQIEASERYHPPPIRKRHPAVRLVFPAIWIAGILAGIPFMLRAEFNPNLLDLQAPKLPSVQLVRKVQTWSGVILSRDLALLRRVRDAVAGLPTVERTESILDAEDNYRWLAEHRDEIPHINWADPRPIEPGDLPVLARSATALSARMATVSQPAADSLRRFAHLLESADPPHAAARLTQWQKVFVAQLKATLAQFTPPPLDLAKAPPELKGHFVSDDGEYALYIYPRQDLWKRDNLAEFVRSVEKQIATVPGAPRLTGIASNIYHSTGSIEKSFYRATAYALALILLLVFLDLKRIVPTLLAVSVLAFGLPMLVAFMGLMNIDWNFANFFGLPILIGAGHEYGVFMMHRYVEVRHNPRRVWSRWDVSDRALLLCAFITSSSFGFFYVFAQHQGLKSLGLVMALGTACIYLATLLVLRPILRWRIERRGLYDEAWGEQRSDD